MNNTNTRHECGLSAQSINEQLESYLASIRKEHREKSLKVGFNRERGYFVAAPESFSAPESWSRYYARGGEVHYTTPELTNITEQAKAAQKQPWQMTRRNYIDSLIAAGELFGVSNGLPTKLVKTTPKGVRTEGGKFVPYGQLSHAYEHRCRVEEAIRKGWPVPAEVLADYPDLAQRVQSPVCSPADCTAR